MRIKIIIAFAAVLSALPFSYSAGNDVEFDQCFESQQKAVWELIQSMKNVRKIIMQSEAEGEGEKKENPFKDKNKYEAPKKEDSPEYQLEKIREKQEELIRKAMDKSADKDARMKEQGEISEKTDKMSNDKKLEDSARSALADAASSSRSAEKAMGANEDELAKTFEDKTLSDLKKALKEIREKSDKQTAESLNEIRKDVNRAGRELKDGKKDKASSSLDKALKKSNGQMSKQASSGKFSNAEKMSGVSKGISEASSGLAKEGIGKASEELDKLKGRLSSEARTKDALQGMRESIEKMEGCLKELKYMEREKNSAQELKKLLEDMQVLSQDMLGYSSALGGNGMKTAAELTEMLDTEIKELEKNKLDWTEVHPLSALALKLITESNQMLANSTGNRKLNIFSPEDAPAEYRKAVGKYFERLSENEEEQGKTK